MKLFCQLTKIDEAKREVWGIATAEVVDKEGEIFDYKSSKPFFEKWSSEISKATDGKSLGNVREMHDNSAVGKLVALNFEDDEKQVQVGAKIIDDDAWKKCAEGVYTGFSIGGSYVKTWKDGEFTRFTANPVEISVVDNPCVPTAHFTAVKADGTAEVRKFQKSGKTKRVAGEDLTASAFAYVGDPDDTSTWKLPIKFSDEEKTKSHIRNALARFDQTQGIPEGERAKVKAKIVAAAKKHGIEVSGSKSTVVILGKGMSQVAALAYLLDQVCYLHDSLEYERDMEGDESPIPDDLAAWIRDGAGIIGAYTEEELSELVSSLKSATDKLGKRGAKHSAETSAHHQSIRKALDGMQKHMDKMAGCYKDADDHMNALMGKDDGMEEAAGAQVHKDSPATEEIHKGEQPEMLDAKDKQQLEKAAADSSSALSKMTELETKVTEITKGQEAIAGALGNITKAIEKMAGVGTQTAQTVARTAVTITKEQDGKPNAETEEKDPIKKAFRDAYQNPQDARSFGGMVGGSK